MTCTRWYYLSIVGIGVLRSTRNRNRGTYQSLIIVYILCTYFVKLPCRIRFCEKRLLNSTREIYAIFYTTYMKFYDRIKKDFNRSEGIYLTILYKISMSLSVYVSVSVSVSVFLCLSLVFSYYRSL